MCIICERKKQLETLQRIKERMEEDGLTTTATYYTVKQEFEYLKSVVEEDKEKFRELMKELKEALSEISVFYPQQYDPRQAEKN
jgi:hypothetical protein